MHGKLAWKASIESCWYVGIFYGHWEYFTAICYISWLLGLFCGHLIYFIAIWYILWPFGMVVLHISPVLVHCVKKNLATLLHV
jgi:hypothetical protein